MNFDKIRDAFNEAMELCYHYGLDWREYMMPFHKNGQIAGYYVLDETKSTAIKKIYVK